MSVGRREQSDTLPRPTRRGLAEASDTELALALCDRDTAALEEAFRRHGDQVARTALRTAGEAYVDDIVQMVFQSLWQTPERFHPERGPLANYVSMLTRSKAIDMQRSDTHRHAREYGAQPGLCDDVEGLAIAGVSAAQLQVALRALPMHERVAIELAYFGGDTYRVVASKLGQPEGTIKSRIRKGLSRLEASLQAMGAA